MTASFAHQDSISVDARYSFYPSEYCLSEAYSDRIHSESQSLCDRGSCESCSIVSSFSLG